MIRNTTKAFATAVVFLLCFALSQVAFAQMPSMPQVPGIHAPMPDMPGVSVPTAGDITLGFVPPRPRAPDPFEMSGPNHHPMASFNPNLYAYVGANPMMYADPLGLCRQGDEQCRRAMMAAGMPNWADFRPDQTPMTKCKAECRIATGGLSLYSTALKPALGGGIVGAAAVGACAFGLMALCEGICDVKAR